MKNNSSWFMSALLLFLGMACFGSATPVSKIVGEDLPVLMAAGIRMLLAGSVLLPFAIARKEASLKLPRRDWLLVIGVAIIGNVGFSVTMLYGMKWVSGVLGSIIMSLTPAITALAAVIFLHEKINLRKIGALMLGLCGVFIMQLTDSDMKAGGQEHVLLGAALIFAAICCEATYTLMGKVATENMTPLKLTTLSSLTAGLLMLPWVSYEATHVTWAEVAMQDWIALIWWGIGTMALGSMLWYSGVKQVPGHIAAGFMVVMPISALTLSYVLLDESFQWIHIPGFGLALAGVYLMFREHASEKKKKQPG